MKEFKHLGVTFLINDWENEPDLIYQQPLYIKTTKPVYVYVETFAGRFFKRCVVTNELMEDSDLWKDHLAKTLIEELNDR